MEHFKKFNGLNVNEHTEDKQGLTYLSWAWAWAETKRLYADAQYEILKFENNLPYVYDEKTGYMVFTKVTIEDLTHEMWLPVMNNANKAMKDKPYKYSVWDRKENKQVEKWVQSATMFDVNKAIMRCLTKNLAMFGLGIYIYAGEDLPDGKPICPDDKIKGALKAIKDKKFTNEEALKMLIEKFELTEEQKVKFK